MVLLEAITAYNAYLKYILPAIAVLCFLGALAWQEKWPFLKGLLSGILAGTALLSVFAHLAPHALRGEYLNGYEFYHYYLGSKYAEEVGYTNLYRATVIAQHELEHRPMPSRVRDLSSGRRQSVASVLQNTEGVKGHFTPLRWQRFKSDVDFFWNRFKSKSLWQRMLQDKGYNATPVWTMVGGALANRVPVERVAWMQVIAALDQALILLAVLAVWRALGHQAALLLVVFFYSHYLNSHATLKAAYLRLDWLCALLISFAALRGNRPGLAGALCAYSASVRIFPVFFALGPLLVYAGARVWKREQHPIYKPFAVRFTQCGIVLLATSILYGGGFAPWFDFWDKILAHSSDFSGWRIGLKYLFLGAWEGQPASGLAPAEHMARYDWHFKLLQVMLLAIWLTALPRQRPEFLFALGVVPFFVLSDATFYYWVVLAVPLLYFLAKPSGIAASAGIVLLFLTSMLGHWLYGEYGRGYVAFFWLSLATSAVMLGMLATSWERSFRAIRSDSR